MPSPGRSQWRCHGPNGLLDGKFQLAPITEFHDKALRGATIWAAPTRDVACVKRNRMSWRWPVGGLAIPDVQVFEKIELSGAFDIATAHEVIVAHGVKKAFRLILG